MKNASKLILLLCVLSTTSTLYAQSLWNAAGNNIQSGQPITAAGINNIKSVIEGIQAQIDSGAGNDNLGNHTASTTLNANDQEIRNIRAIQGKDWDDNTGGTDSKYRLLFRDGAHMFYDGGVAVGGWGNGTWTDLASGDLAVQDQIMLGTTTTSGNLATGASLAIGDSDTGFKQMGDGQLGVFANNGERIRVAANGNVGIGTTSPSSKLQVNGTMQSTGAIVNAGGSYSNIRVGSDLYDQLYADNTPGGSFGGGLWFRVTNSAGTGYTDNLRLAENGNVGIGTNPTQRLDVSGNVRATNFLGSGSSLTSLNASNISSGTLNLARIANNSIPAGKLAPNSVALSELSATGTKNTTTFLRGDNTFAVPPNGADNLGNHYATQDLYLQNRALVSAGGTNVDFIRHDDGPNVWLFGSDRPDTTASGGSTIEAGTLSLTGRNIIMGTGAQRFYGDNGSAFYADSNNAGSVQMIFRDIDDTVFGRVYGSGNGSDFGLLDGDGNWGIQMKKDLHTGFMVDNTEHMRILANGHVGIGTTSPESTLHVIRGGSGQPTAIFEQTGASPNIAMVDATDGMRFEYNSGANSLRIQSANSNGSYGGATLAVFDRTGNVGIGTMVPSERLDVEGNIKLNNTLEFDGGAGIDLTATRVGTTDTLTISSNDYIDLSTGANGVVLRASVNGNVGIGTSSPADKLHVDGTVRANRFTDANNTGYYVDPASQSLLNDVRANIFYDRANTAYYANPASESRFNALRMNGNLRRAATNVGHLEGSYNNVGNNQAQTNPIYTIGSAYNPDATALGNMYGIGYTSGSSVSFVTGNGSGWGMYLAADGDARTFLSGAAGGNTYLNRDGGNVGINTDNPGRQLDVNGIVRATSFQGNGANLTALNASNISSGTLNLARIANNSIPAGKLAANSVGISELSAGGTKNSSTFLRGDNTFATIPAVNSILDGTPGNWEVASNSNDDIYTSAALEVRELNNGGAQSGSNAQAPRIAFHWGGRVATQIGMGSAGVVRTFDNPGTGYAPFAASTISANGNLSSTGNIYAGGTEYFGDGKRMFRFNDSYLRLNPSNEFTSGIYAGTLPLRTDGELQAGNNGDRFVVKTNGNVGIGDTTPNADLHIKRPGDAVIRLEADTDNVTETDNPRIDFYQDGGTVQARIGYVNGLNVFDIKNIFNDHLTFGTNNTERMRITNSGNVAIGQTNADDRLEVSGNIRAFGSSPSFRLRDAGGSANQNFQMRVVNGDLLFERNNDAFSSPIGPFFKIGKNGNVGINNSTPSGAFEIGTDNQTGSNPTTTFNGGGNATNEGAELRIGTANDFDGAYNYYYLDAWQDDFRIGRAGIGDDFVIASNGNIGMGVIAPADALDVNGNVRANRLVDRNNAGYYVDPDAISQIVGLDMNDYIRHRGDTDTHIGFPANDTIRLRTGGTDRLSVSSNGRVGIGTNSPSSLFEVNGNISANNYCDANGANCVQPAKIQEMSFTNQTFETPGDGNGSNVCDGGGGSSRGWTMCKRYMVNAQNPYVQNNINCSYTGNAGGWFVHNGSPQYLRCKVEIVGNTYGIPNGLYAETWCEWSGASSSGPSKIFTNVQKMCKL